MQDFIADTKDLLKVRTITLKSGNAINIRSEGPYGFWYISWERGQLPENLKGAYTSATEAENAVGTYLAEKGKEVKEVAK